MALSAPGIGSSLDVNGIVGQLMAVERRPLSQLNAKEAGLQGKISALGMLKGVLSALQTAAGGLVPATGQTAAEKFTSFKAAVADTSVLTASASRSVAAGTYSIETLALAREQRLVTAANPGIEAGAQTITIELGSVSGGVFTPKAGTSPITVALDGSNNTLEGIRDAINAKNEGVTASIINAADGQRLVLASKASGAENQVRVTGGITALNYDPTTPVSYDEGTPPAVMSELQSAQNASAKVNGITVSSATNVFSEVVTGLSFTIQKAAASTTVSVSRDTGSLKSSLEALVKAYNDANKAMRDLGSYDPQTKKAGPLNGDAALRTSQNQLRSALSSAQDTGGAYTRLSDIGITFQTDGSLKLDATKLQAAIDADFETVAKLASGIGETVKAAADGLLGSGGAVTARTDGINASIKDIGKRREALELRMISIEKRYRAQFTALDTLVSSMTQTSNFLAQQLANLPKVGG